MTRDSERLSRAPLGFTLPEALVAMVLLAVLAGAVAGVIVIQTRSAHAQPDAVDVQQRARFAIEVIGAALRAAGAGAEYGPDPGPLRLYLPPVLPRRIGAAAADLFSTARLDAISIVSIPATSVQTALRDAVTSPADGVAPVIAQTCTPGDPVCGIRPGMPLLLFDRRARFDVLSVASVAGDRASVRLWHANPSFDYPAGASVARADVAVYYLDAAARQIRSSDGDGSDTPLIDGAVGLAFEYFGDPEPPMSPKPPAGIANCLYDELGVRRPAVSLAPGGRALIPLSLGMFTDGPWCGAGDLQFDADVLRVRSVRVTVRVQATGVMARGRGGDYASPGQGRDALALVPDLSMTIDVAPRNMQGGR
jgi:prepilin-type N-terminal cleavage/methylation domain-containing protein